MRTINSFSLGVLFFITTTHSALACMSTRESELFKPSLVMAFTVVAISILLFFFVSWLIKIIFFRAQSRSSIIFLVTFLFSVALGVFGTFVVPSFEEFFRDFGEDISRELNFIFTYGNYLWIPLFFVLVLLFFLENSFSRNRYFAVVLFVEAVILVFSLAVINGVTSSCG